MRGSDDFWQAWIEQVELPAWQAGRSCSSSDIFNRIQLASAEERYLLSSDHLHEVMAIIHWEAATDARDRVDMELFGFLYFHDDATLSANDRQDRLLHAIEHWGSINRSTLNPFVVWQAYLKTLTRLALWTDCRTETERDEGCYEKSNHGQKRADVIGPDGQQSIRLPVDAGQPGVIGHGAPVSNSQWGAAVEPANV